MKKLVLVVMFMTISGFGSENVKLTEFGDFLHFVYRNEDSFLKKDAIKKIDFSKLSGNFRVQVMTVLSDRGRGDNSEINFYFKEKTEALVFIKQLLRYCSRQGVNEVGIDNMFKGDPKKKEKKGPIVGSGSSIIK